MGYNDSALEMMKQHGIVLFSCLPRKFHARRNNNEVNSIEAGRIVILREISIFRSLFNIFVWTPLTLKVRRLAVHDQLKNYTGEDFYKVI